MPAASLATLLAQSGLTGAIANGFPANIDPLAGGRAAMQAALPSRNSRPSRTRLHELHPSLHCSVIGTCFGLRELRNLVVKFTDPSLAQAGDHTVHTEAVRRASHRDGLGRMLSKTLDWKFKANIAQFARGADVADLRRMWLDAMANGDIPGAYWAVLTHAAATKDLIGEAFSDVHMLSHLVGAANRADIRRLQELEREKSALEDKLARQQRHLTDTLGARERQIRELLGTLADQERRSHAQPDGDDLAESLKRERYQRMQLERRIETLESRLAAAEQAIPPRAPASAPDPAPGCCCEEHAAVVPPEPVNLERTTLLLVGGRPAQVSPLTRAVERAGGTLLHHDGGREMSLSLLPGMVGRADRVVVALDCVSHAAAASARRLVRDKGKALSALPNLSLSSLLGAVGTMVEAVES